MEEKKAVILLSGGLDSTTVLAEWRGASGYAAANPKPQGTPP